MIIVYTTHKIILYTHIHSCIVRASHDVTVWASNIPQCHVFAMFLCYIGNDNYRATGKWRYKELPYKAEASVSI